MRTDLNIVQLPATIPNWGGLLGKNTIQIDPDFNQPIVRLSDGSDFQGKTIKTSDYASAGLWNKDDTLFAAKATGGWLVLYQFDPVHMQGTKINLAHSLGATDICFSRVYPSVLFQLVGTKVNRIVLTRTGGQWAYQGISQVCDFATCLPPGYSVAWNSAFLVSHDDTTISVAFSNGLQNTGIYACSYQTGHSGKGYRVVNTQAGMVSGSYGTNGPANLQSTAKTFPFTIHEFYQTPNDQYAPITAQAYNSPMIWNISTQTLLDPNTSGHAAYGMYHLYTGGPGGGQVAEYTYNTGVKRLVIPKTGLPSGQTPVQQYSGDQHFAFGKVDTTDQTDNSIIWVSSQSQVSPFTSAWINEVRGVQVATGLVFRACHTFNSGLSPEFDVQNAIAVPSQTGNFVAFSSDAMQSLGSNRGDVFVVKTNIA